VRRSLLALAVAVMLPLAAAQDAIVPPSERDAQIAEYFGKAGLNPNEPDSFVDFIAHGWSSGKRSGGRPAGLTRWIDLLPLALEEAAMRDMQAARAAMMRLAQGDLSAPWRRLIQEDGITIPAAQRPAFLAQIDQLVRYSACNALSLMGEPAVLPLLRREMAAATSDAARVRWATLGAYLGDPGYVKTLASIARNEAHPSAAMEALAALDQLRGADEVTQAWMPWPRRKAALEDSLTWAKNLDYGAMMDRGEIRAQRLVPLPVRPRPEQLSTLRSVVLWAGVIDEGEHGKLGREARRQLGEMTGAGAASLRSLALDADEDVDVRLQAMLWHGRANPNAHDALLSAMSEDRDPLVREVAAETQARRDE